MVVRINAWRSILVIFCDPLLCNCSVDNQGSLSHGGRQWFCSQPVRPTTHVFDHRPTTAHLSIMHAFAETKGFGLLMLLIEIAANLLPLEGSVAGPLYYMWQWYSS